MSKPWAPATESGCPKASACASERAMLSAREQTMPCVDRRVISIAPETRVAWPAFVRPVVLQAPMLGCELAEATSGMSEAMMPSSTAANKPTVIRWATGDRRPVFARSWQVGDELSEVMTYLLSSVRDLDRVAAVAGELHHELS